MLAVAGCGGGRAATPTTPNPSEPASGLDLRVAPGAASVAVGESVQLVTTVTDARGRPLADPPQPAFTSSAPEVATVSASGLVTGVAAGSAMITATASANGASRSATAAITVRSGPGLPAGNVVGTSGTSFLPTTTTINAGDSVTCQFSGATHNVTFTGATPPGGNIPDQAPGNAVRRAFPSAGTYGYDCTRHSGMTGQVIVQGSTPPIYTTLVVPPASPAILVGGTVTITATARDQHGNPMSGVPAPGFSSSAPSVATVSASGWSPVCRRGVPRSRRR
jgi:plastocyanin